MSISSPPQRVVGYSGQRVSYNCTVCGSGALFWIINDTWSTSPASLGEPFWAEKHFVYTTLEERTSTLTVQASPATNLTEIRCRTSLTNRPPVISDPVPIVVQGIVIANPVHAVIFRAHLPAIASHWIWNKQNCTYLLLLPCLFLMLLFITQTCTLF